MFDKLFAKITDERVKKLQKENDSLQVFYDHLKEDYDSMTLRAERLGQDLNTAKISYQSMSDNYNKLRGEYEKAIQAADNFRAMYMEEATKRLQTIHLAQQIEQCQYIDQQLVERAK